MKRWVIGYFVIGVLWASFTTFKQYDIWPETPTSVAVVSFTLNTLIWPISITIGVWSILHE